MKFQEADDVHIMGFTFEEKKRVKKFTKNNPEIAIENILIDNKMTRKKCFDLFFFFLAVCFFFLAFWLAPIFLAQPPFPLWVLKRKPGR